jgi:hypothetical protein
MDFVTGIAGYYHSDLESEGKVYENGDDFLYNSGFSGNISFGATDVAQNLIATGSEYRPDIDDYFYGILDEVGEVVEGSDDFYRKVWIIHDFQIIQHINSFIDGNLEQENIPEDILTWPALGNPNVEQAFVQTDLAAFFDQNQDGIYNPLDGDYPIADRENISFIPSTFTFNTFHDNGDKVYTQTPVGHLQFAQTQYVINCNQSDLSNSVFTNISIKNCSTQSLLDSRIGVFIDVDLGCHTNDYFGVDTITNSVYIYNQNGVETMPCEDGLVPVPQSLGAAVSFVFDEKLSSVVPFYSNLPQANLPDIGFQLYNALGGTFSDGTPMTFGGNGLDPLSIDEIKFPFTNFPNDENGWSQQTADFGDYDVRATANFEIGTLSPGQIARISFARVDLIWDAPVGLEAFQTYQDRIDGFNQEHEDLLSGTSNQCAEIELCETDCVWPGDVNSNGRVGVSDIVYQKAFMDLVGEGPNRNTVDAQWYAHTSDNWGVAVDGIDAKHGDVNGNGILNSTDVFTLQVDNFGFVNSTYQENPVLPSIDAQGITIEFNQEDIDSDGGLLDRVARGNIIIGDDSGLINSNYTAISMEFVWDTTLLGMSPFFFFPDGQAFDVGHANVLINGNYEQEPSLSFENAERLEYAKVVSTDMPITVGGKLGEFSWEAKETGSTGNEDGIDTTYINIRNITATDGEGNIVTVGVQKSFRLIISGLEYDPDLSNKELSVSSFSLYPNPVSQDMIYFSEPLISYKVFNAMGEVVTIVNGDNIINEVDISDLKSGVYILEGALDRQVKVASRFVVLH